MSLPTSHFAPDVPTHLRLESGAPHPNCRYCSQPNLFGQVQHRPGRSKPEQRVAAALRRHRLHTHTLVNVGGHEADIALPISPCPVVVEYDGSYWHQATGDLERRQRDAWEAAGFRVVRLREAPLEPSSEWDLVLPAPFNSFDAEWLVATVVMHVVEAARIRSYAETGDDHAAPIAPQGWWTATTRHGAPLARWRTYPAAYFGVREALLATDLEWEAGDEVAALNYMRDRT
jgi:hypothetical protein